MQTASNLIIRFATSRNLLLAGVGFFLMATVIMPAAKQDILLLSHGVGPLDISLWYSPDTARHHLEAYGMAGRGLYRFIQMTADVVYPLVYTCFFCLLLGWLAKRSEGRRLDWYLPVPILVLFFDFLENTCVVAMLSMFPKFYPWLAIVSGAATFLKWSSLALVLVLVVYFMVKSKKGTFHLHTFKSEA